MALPEVPVCFLVDNGSLRAESTLSLRRIAMEVEKAIGRRVDPVSLLHSSSIPISQLENLPAQLLEIALQEKIQSGARDFVILPLFFGPSTAINGYLDSRIDYLIKVHGPLNIRVAKHLVDITDPGDIRIARILADNATRTIANKALIDPVIVLVDHGSPQRAVTEVRNFLARQLQSQLSDDIPKVIAASMERRQGAEYEFAEPLLSSVLRQLTGDVVVVLQFLSPGRHAGEGGDIQTICMEAEASNPGLRTHTTSLVGQDIRLAEVLVDRYRQATENKTSGDSERPHRSDRPPEHSASNLRRHEDSTSA